jgi:hypothetical protein
VLVLCKIFEFIHFFFKKWRHKKMCSHTTGDGWTYENVMRYHFLFLGQLKIAHIKFFFVFGGSILQNNGRSAICQ